MTSVEAGKNNYVAGADRAESKLRVFCPYHQKPLKCLKQEPHLKVGGKSEVRK